MGKSPAVLIVVRHGARLDAADKQWHLTSPTPYDPPLSYGGWVQSRALGARIAGLLRSRETDDDVTNNSKEKSSGETFRRRKHKVIIHSSPFLRCVQTAIAISAGLSQIPSPPAVKRPTSPPSNHHSQYSSRVPSSLSIDTSHIDPLPENRNPVKNGKQLEGQSNIKKAVLRVDAFLGEWLSPDYFELITPPPSSIMMVAGAKADLLRREDYNNLIHVADIAPAGSSQGFPGGWGSQPASADADRDITGLSSMSGLAQSLPSRSRGSSLGARAAPKSTKASTAFNAELGIYQAPIPSYAISNSAPIPAGYVAHARDACTDIDYQWDSMRAPQSWGDGGEYGEEWSSMHKRFRKGLLELLRWYRDSDDVENLQRKLAGKDMTNIDCFPGEDEDDDTDLVVILVTHGAGCNALIGALTNQPVLLDVGTASLTMAVRKPSPKATPSTTPGASPKAHSRTSSISHSIHDDYDVKLVANTEHLRPSERNSPANSRNASVTSLARARYSPSNNSSVDGIIFSESGRSGQTSAAVGSIRRTASVNTSSQPRVFKPARTESFGLWSPSPAVEETEPEEPEDDMILNFGDGANDATSAIVDDKSQPAPPEPIKAKLLEVREIQELAEQNEEDKVAPLGLWGMPRPPGEAERTREIGPKRRWTVNEKSVGP